MECKSLTLAAFAASGMLAMVGAKARAEPASAGSAPPSAQMRPWLNKGYSPH
jgi:hypothetical protein